MVKKWRWATSFKHCPNSKLLNAMIHQWIKTGPQAISSDLAQTNSSLSLSLQVFFVSDLFKKKEEAVKPEEISHASFVESPTNGNFESPN